MTQLNLSELGSPALIFKNKPQIAIVAANIKFTVPTLEVQRYLGGNCSGSYIMRSAEGGQEVIQRILIYHIDRRQIKVRLVVIRVEQIVLAQ